MLKRAIVGALVTTGALWVLAPACSSSPDLAGAGGDCLQVTDCQDGLICCRKQNNTGKCSSDLSCIVSIEEAGGAVQTMPSDAAPADGGTRDSSAPPSDASTRDTSQPPSETGPPPPDSGRPPADTGAAPPPDSGSAATG